MQPFFLFVFLVLGGSSLGMDLDMFWILRLFYEMKSKVRPLISSIIKSIYTYVLKYNLKIEPIGIAFVAHLCLQIAASLNIYDLRIRLEIYLLSDVTSRCL